MKWKSPIPKYGDARVSRKFAFIPVQIGDEEVWLERYWAKEHYTHGEWMENDITQDPLKAFEWKMDKK